MLSTDQKGAIAESAIVLEAIKLGVGVYRPVTEGERYDLILDTGERLLRIQCKWGSVQRGAVVVRCYSCRRVIDGMRVRKYTSDEIDAIAVYCHEVRSCYLLPMTMVRDRRHIFLRIAGSLNNQRRGVNWARDFEFEARLRDFGAVAQLGERRAGSA